MAGDLERQLVADPRWRWIEGVRVCVAGSWRRIAQDDEDLGAPEWAREWVIVDLSDPATAGILLSWLPRTWMLEAVPGGVLATANTMEDDGPICADTLGDAVARALLALPPETPWGGKRG